MEYEKEEEKEEENLREGKLENVENLDYWVETLLRAKKCQGW